jgi:hypothetical protein
MQPDRLLLLSGQGDNGPQHQVMKFAHLREGFGR